MARTSNERLHTPHLTLAVRPDGKNASVRGPTFRRRSSYNFTHCLIDMADGKRSLRRHKKSPNEAVPTDIVLIRLELT